MTLSRWILTIQLIFISLIYITKPTKFGTKQRLCGFHLKTHFYAMNLVVTSILAQSSKSKHIDGENVTL